MSIKWYKQNRELKRKSSVLMQKVMLVAPSTLNDITDDTDGNDNDTEMEELRKTVKGKTIFTCIKNIVEINMTC